MTARRRSPLVEWVKCVDNAKPARLSLGTLTAAWADRKVCLMRCCRLEMTAMMQTTGPLPRQIHLPFSITPQMTDTDCGSTCLQSVYAQLGRHETVDDIRERIHELDGGGTLASFLAADALKLGFAVRMFTCNLHLFDPTWADLDLPALRDRLERQAAVKTDPRLVAATKGQLDLIDLGAEIRFEDVSAQLLLRLLVEDGPIIAGLSATWLYRCARERTTDLASDDIQGEPTGHFVVITGLNLDAWTAEIADPYLQQPWPGAHEYTVSIDRLINAILLGIVTYDAKLLTITQSRAAERSL